MIGIYKITSPTGAIYIGQSKSIESRITHYRRVLCKSQFRIYNSLVKHGWDAHAFEVIEECSEELLNEREEYYVKFFDTFNTDHGMNLRPGGGNHKLSEESKRRISIGNKGKVRPQHILDALSKLHKGKTISEAQRAQHKIFMTGRKQSPEIIAKRVNSLKMNKKPASPETSRRRSEAAKKKMTKEQIAKMIKGREGKIPLWCKPVINLSTGIFYDSGKEAASCHNLKYDWLKRRLCGTRKNNTNFMYI